MPATKRWTHRIQCNVYKSDYDLIVKESHHRDMTQAQLLRHWFRKFPIEETPNYKMKSINCPTCKQVMPMTHRIQFASRQHDYKRVGMEARKRKIPQMELLRMWMEKCLTQELIIV